MTKEVWKPIENYEGYYEVSDLGRVKSLIGWNGAKYVKREKILKGWAQTTGKGDYKRHVVRLTKKGKSREHKVHRLVALAFIPNPENKPEVNHIDGNPMFNNVSNLEWVTSKENSIHALETGLMPSYRGKEKEIIRDYKSGMNQKEITNKYRTSYQSIKKVLIEHNISIRSIGEAKDKYKIDRKVLVEDFKNGLTNPVIAKKHNTNKVLIATYKYKWKKGEF